MKILFALDPWIYRDIAGDQLYTLENIFISSIKALSNYGHDVKLLVGEDILEVIKDKNLKISCDIYTMPFKDLYEIYPNHYEAHKTQHENKDTDKQKKLFKKLVKKELSNWNPDVIISFTTPVLIWKKCYPKALSMQFENGIFSRPPYPYLCQLDPFGFLSNSYPYVFLEQIRNKNITEEQTNRMIQLKKRYEDKIFKPHNPFKREDLIDYPDQKVLLVPLSYNGVIINDSASIYKSQLDFLLHVMHNVPKDVIVLFTKHSLQMKGEIPEVTEKYLMSKFPNLRYNESFDHYAFCSQWLTPMVDGIISLNSTVAYHGAFWGKKIFTIGKCEINSVATSDNLQNVEDDLSRKYDYDIKAYNVLYHLLSRYCFQLKDFWNAEWLTGRFEKLIHSKKSGKLESDFLGMPLLENEDDIFKRLLEESPALADGYKPRVR